MRIRIRSLDIVVLRGHSRLHLIEVEVEEGHDSALQIHRKAGLVAAHLEAGHLGLEKKIIRSDTKFRCKIQFCNASFGKSGGTVRRTHTVGHILQSSCGYSNACNKGLKLATELVLQKCHKNPNS